MKIIHKEMHRLNSGRLFAVLSIEGKRGESIDLAAEGFSEDPTFFMETPKSMVNCSYVPNKRSIILGGATGESTRHIYLIFGA